MRKNNLLGYKKTVCTGTGTGTGSALIIYVFIKQHNIQYYSQNDARYKENDGGLISIKLEICNASTQYHSLLVVHCFVQNIIVLCHKNKSMKNS